MGKLCLLCKYERQPDDQAPETECPGCGALYANVEAQRKAAAAAAQARAMASIRSKRGSRAVEGGGFPLFRSMVTPWLSVALFVLILVIGGITFVYAALDGNAGLMAAAAIGVIATRIALESVVVVFRISDDVAATRDLLADILEQQVRQGSRRD